MSYGKTEGFRALRRAMGFYFWLIPGSDTGNQEGISPSADGDQPARLDRAGSQTRTRLSPAGENPNLTIKRIRRQTRRRRRRLRR